MPNFLLPACGQVEDAVCCEISVAIALYIVTSVSIRVSWRPSGVSSEKSSGLPAHNAGGGELSNLRR